MYAVVVMGSRIRKSACGMNLRTFCPWADAIGVPSTAASITALSTATQRYPPCFVIDDLLRVIVVRCASAQKPGRASAGILAPVCREALRLPTREREADRAAEAILRLRLTTRRRPADCHCIRKRRSGRDIAADPLCRCATLLFRDGGLFENAVEQHVGACLDMRRIGVFDLVVTDAALAR